MNINAVVPDLAQQGNIVERLYRKAKTAIIIKRGFVKIDLVSCREETPAA
jgi:hypothetical protein